MAKYSTNIEAGKALSDQLQVKSRELRGIYDSTKPADVARASKLKAEIGGIQNELMMLTNIGSIGGGLAKGVTGLLTAVPDIVIAGKNLLTGSKTEGLGDRLTPGLQAPSQEQAGLFGAARGFGGSVGLGPKMLLANVGASTLDEAALDGNPIAQSLLAITTLGYSGAQGVRNLLKGRQINKLMDQLPAEDANALKDFMVKGQSASDPLVAGKVAALRQNPKYAELFTALEKKATEVSTAGARVETLKGYPKEQAGSAIFQAVEGKVDQLREAITKTPKSKFDAAMKMGGNNDILSTENTIKNIDDLIVDYSRKGTDDAKAAISFLNRFKNQLTTTTSEATPAAVSNINKQLAQTDAGLVVGAGSATIPAGTASTTTKISPEKMQALLQEFGSQAKQGENLITDVSLGTQKRIATAIFGGLKDDLVLTKDTTGVQRIKNIAETLEGARNDVANAYSKYSDFIAQGLPAKLKNKAINEIDTDELLGTIKSLSNAQRERLAGVLNNTAPEDLKRVRQVMYDDFVQSARTTLADGSTGVDLKLLANKFNTLDEKGREAMAFSVGTNIDDFSSRMKDAENFFKYQQRYGKPAEGGTALNTGAVDALSSAAAVSMGYGPAKAVSLLGRIGNFLSGGLTDDQTLSLLMRPETKGLLREVITSPNSLKTLDKLEQSVLSPVASTARQGAIVAAGATEAAPSDVVQQTQGGSRPALDLTIPDDAAPDAGTETQGGSRPTLDLSYNPLEIEQKIRAQAEAKGYGQYADMFVRQAKQESGLNPYAVSPKGAAGVFQHMPGTAKDLNIDPFDIDQSIAGGIDYMGQQLNKFKDPRLALAAYNWGPGNVSKSGLAGAPAETQNYIKSILGS